MLVWVFRSNYKGMDTQVSNIWDRLLLTGEGVAEVFEETDPTKVVKLVRREIGGRDYLHAEPVVHPNGGDPSYGMFGGNYISTCDSRFPNDYPIGVHDRFES